MEASWLLVAAPQLVDRGSVRTGVTAQAAQPPPAVQHNKRCENFTKQQNSWKWNLVSEFTSSFVGNWLFSILFKIDKHQFLRYLCISEFLQAEKTSPKCQISKNIMSVRSEFEGKEAN